VQVKATRDHVPEPFLHCGDRIGVAGPELGEEGEPTGRAGRVRIEVERHRGHVEEEGVVVEQLAGLDVEQAVRSSDDHAARAAVDPRGLGEGLGQVTDRCQRLE
jgi:hypothetical protein